jgi:transposase-like protein
MKPAEKQQARLLRSQGYSVKEISRQLSVSRASVSLWVRDIQLTAEQIERLEARNNLNREKFGYLSRCGGANTNKADAEARHAAFRQAGFERAKRDEGFRLICALYWGEGQKSNHVFGVCNSDPTLLKFVLRWLVQEGFDDIVRFTVRYHPDNGLSEEEIKAWWMAKLPWLREKHLRKFGQCIIHRASQRKKIGKLPYGTAAVEVCRSELYYQVMGGIDYLREMGDW